MSIFKDKGFARFARHQSIGDRDLCEAIARAEGGHIDADLGGGVIKQRIARPNDGRSGGFRTIIFFRSQERAFFVFGFAKNDTGNISATDLRAFRRAAQVTLAFGEAQIRRLIEAGDLTEVTCDEKNLQK